MLASLALLPAAALGERLPARRADALVSRRLSRLVRHAATSVPFYRDLYAGIPADELRAVRAPGDLAALPWVGREQLRDTPLDRRFARGFSATDTERTLTGGSSGIPVTVHNSTADLRYLRAVFLHDLLRAGLRPWDRAAVFRTRPLGGHPLRRLRVLPFHWIPTQESLDRQVDRFLEVRPTFLTGFPSVMAAVARELRRRRIAYRGVRSLLAGGERLLPGLRAELSDYFRAPVHELYASVEAFTIARSCQVGTLHVRTCDVVVEVLSDDGTSSATAGDGEVLVTRLRSEAMPLIRYRLGDRISLRPPGCRCGRLSPVIACVHGRTEDLVEEADGRLTNVDSVAAILQFVGGVRRFQIVQERPGALRIDLVAQPGTPAADAPGVARLLRAASGHFAFHVRHVDEVPLEAGGKVRLVKRLGPRDGDQPGSVATC